jgi:2-oxo-4-hydroxy-4-carboxy-5-ureidoimidazoline decarboxylase
MRVKSRHGRLAGVHGGLRGGMTIDDLNRASATEFTAALGAVYEHSPWVAARAAAQRPFEDVAALHQAMSQAVSSATAEEQMALVNAHPDLAGKLARAGQLAPSSAGEQAALGLDRLPDDEFEMFDRLNRAYRARFGFPFVIAVRRHTRSSVLAAFQRRLENDPATELRTALAEIDAIARFRLDAMLAGGATRT